MITSTYIQIQFKNIGYEIVSTSIRGVVCAYDPTREAPVPVIAICDNRENYILTRVNTDQIRRILSEDIGIPDFTDVLFVLLNKWKTRELAVENHVAIDCGSGKWHSGRIKSGLNREYRILTDILTIQRSAESKNRLQQPFSCRTYPVRATYLMLAFLLFFYPVFSGTAAECGVSYNTLASGEYTRLLSYMFAHGGILHLIGNMTALWFAGRILERKNGAASFFLVYILSGIAAGLFTAAFNGDPARITIGASGAIYGLLGAIFAAEALTDKHQRELPLSAVLSVIVGSLFAGTRYLNTDNLCHIGGLFFGMLVMCIITLCRMICWDIQSIKRQRFFNQRIIFSGIGGR